MGSSSSRKRKMFEKAASALALLERDGRGGVYICPLCRSAFGIDCLDKCDGVRLTEEHAPQKFFGEELSDARCLTCKDCNGAYGDTIERSVAPRLRTRMTQHTCQTFGNRQAAADLVPTKMCRLGDKYEIAVVRQRLELPLRLEPYEQLVELRSAILIAFVALGYSYVLGTGPREVLQLLDTAPHRMPQTCLPIQNSAHGKSVPARAIIVIESPIKCVLVMHPSPHCRSGLHAIVLPPADHPGDFYETFSCHRALLASMPIVVSETRPWPKPRQLPMEWDVCPNDHHPRTGVCFGSEDVGHFGQTHMKV